MYAPSPSYLSSMIPDDSEFFTTSSQSMSSHTPDDELFPPVDPDFLAEFENSMDVVDDVSDEDDGMVEVVIPCIAPQVANTEVLLEVQPSPTVTLAPTPLQEGTIQPNDTLASTSVEALSPIRELSKSERRALATRARKAAPPLAPVPPHLMSGHISALDVALGRRKQPDWMKTDQATDVTTLPRAREPVPAQMCEASCRKRTRSTTDRETAGSTKKSRTVPPPFIAAARQARPLFFSSAAQIASPSTGNINFSAPSSSHEPVGGVAFTRIILPLTPTNRAAFTKKYKNLPTECNMLAHIICADVPVITADTTVICPQDHACVLLSDFERHVAQCHYTGNSFKCRCHGSKIETFATAKELVKHMRNSHLVETKFRCPHCPARIAPVEKNMRDHLLRTCHGMETFE